MRSEIREFRKSKDWTQAEFAQRLGVGQGAVSNIERGARGISKVVALRLNALDSERFPLDRLLDAEPEEIPRIHSSADGHTRKERVPTGEGGAEIGSARPEDLDHQDQAA